MEKLLNWDKYEVLIGSRTFGPFYLEGHFS